MKTFILSLLLLLLPVSASSQITKYQALFITQFVKNTGWPPDDVHNDLVIMILDNDEALFREVSKLSYKIKVGTRKVVVESCPATAFVEHADVIFVSKKKSSSIYKVVSKMKSHTLLIVEGAGMCEKGASISLYANDKGGYSFDISMSNLTKSGLIMSQRVISLGNILD